jgi:hypothetical protein
MLPTTAERVTSNTCEEVNQQIAEQTAASIDYYASAGRQDIDQRLADLDEEWDIERYLETMASSFSLVGLFLSVTKSRKFLVIPAIVQTFFLQHALQGWCPPLPVLRRLGIRTADEINKERYALKALRGDFKRLSPKTAMDAVDA